MNAEQITAPLADHGEGAVWDDAAQLVRLVDVFRGDVLSYDPSAGAVRRHHISGVASCVVPRMGGGVAVATERGFTLVDAAGALEPLGDLWDDPSVRMNDGACDSRGRFYCGSMAYDEAEGRGCIYRLDVDRSVHRVLEGVTVSNGLGWHRDGHTAYYVDTPTRRVDAFAFDAANGMLTDRRTIVDLTDVAGVPDGLTVDCEGGIWVALWGGCTVNRYVDGRLDETIDVPTRQVTSCAFGGRQLDQLFITTSAHGLAEPEPAAGALFVVQPGVRGLATSVYGG